MNATPPDWIAQLLRAVKPLLPKDFVGQIEVNCFLGGVTNVTVRQSYKPPQKEKRDGDADG